MMQIRHVFFIFFAASVVLSCSSNTQKAHVDFHARAKALVAQMTLEEKIGQLSDSAPAIPRLNIPKYTWWNEALHGVARAGEATVFPQAIAMAATFDESLMFTIADVISSEGRAKYHNAIKHNQRERYQGLTFWSPNINIFRDPRWGRGQETYGEDPYLTGRLGVAFVKGMQGDDPIYRKTDAMAKHYAVHNGPEADRHVFDVHPSKRDLWDTYLPAFEDLIRDADVAAIMSAYNRVYGEPAPSSKYLLRDILRERWGFKGYVVSDCWAVRDIWKNHKVVETKEEAAAIALRNGTELNCGSTYPYLSGAVEQGLITEEEITAAAEMLFFTRFRLGMFDEDKDVPWADTPPSVNMAPKHNELALKTAEKSMVLLKNDGILPLSKNLKRIAVIGPTADSVPALLGNYHGLPKSPTTLLEGIRQAVSPKTKVVYAKGSMLVEGRNDIRSLPAIDAKYLKPELGSGQRGWKAEYFSNNTFSGEPVYTRIDQSIDFNWQFNGPLDELVLRGQIAEDVAPQKDRFSIRWSGVLTPPVTGLYEIALRADDKAQLFLDDKLLASVPNGTQRGQAFKLDLKAGQNYKIKFEYVEQEKYARCTLGWRIPNTQDPLDEAVALAKGSDVVVFVGGLTAELEGEEMKVSYPGFFKGDRTDIRLPKSQRDLLQALHATGTPVVMALTSGSALAVDWAQAHIPGIILVWYPGQRGGEALANILFGDANPAGRLPVTFYKGDEPLPPFDDYDMNGRTYRYFSGEPLYPFGYGLSYTSFAYEQLEIETTRSGQEQIIFAQVRVTNNGSVAGDEVVQLYVAERNRSQNDAIKNLRGVERIHLKAGESKVLSFEINVNQHLRKYDESVDDYKVHAGEYAIQIGASSGDIRVEQSITVQ